VRCGFAEARGDVVLILDSDMGVAPEDVPKFVRALSGGKGELINGSRLVYPMEGKAMRFLNLLANKTFALLFSWLLGQQVRDTLCGTKALYRADYERIAEPAPWVDAMNITDNTAAHAHASNVAVAIALAQAGVEPILQVVCRDKNRLAIQADIVGAAMHGVENVCCLTGDDVTARRRT